MSLAGSQRRTFLGLLAELRPHLRSDFALPARLQSLLTSRRAFGARDRRLYRELLYTTLRHLPWIEPLLESDPDEAVRRAAWLAADLPCTTRFREAFATGDAPAGDLAECLPAWFRPHCPELYVAPELAVQFRRPPLWIRLQTPEPDRVLDEFTQRSWSWRASPALPGAIALSGDIEITQTLAWREGRCEVQDLGSQLLLPALGLEPGGRWLDACAGAGGKTLQLAHLLGPTARIDAHDIRPAALAELRRRAERAHLPGVRTVSAPDPAGYDGVLVDAPCSGSGTWRRSPHLKWVSSEAAVARAAATQLRLLREYGACVRPGGRLVYATCSLSRRENEEIVAAFLADAGPFSPVPLAAAFDLPAGNGRLTVWPARHDTDGFFVASFRRC